MPIHFYDRRPQAERRLRALDVDADIFLDIFKGMDATRLLKCEAIPEDARVVGLTVDEQYNTVRLYVESKGFAPVDECSPIPHWDLSVSVWYPRYEPGRMIFETEGILRTDFGQAMERHIAERLGSEG